MKWRSWRKQSEERDCGERLRRPEFIAAVRHPVYIQYFYLVLNATSRVRYRSRNSSISPHKILGAFYKRSRYPIERSISSVFVTYCLVERTYTTSQCYYLRNTEIPQHRPLPSFFRVLSPFYPLLFPFSAHTQALFLHIPTYLYIRRNQEKMPTILCIYSATEVLGLL